jgi:protein-L-isoaspartate O-methyltransferase
MNKNQSYGSSGESPQLTVSEMMNFVQIHKWVRVAALLIPAAAIWMAGPAQSQMVRHPVSGRVIAGVMGVGGAPWLERSERESEERPSLAVKLLKLQPGMAVADIGAGSGYYTELLAKAVGAEGKVYATDIQPGMLQLLRGRLRREKLLNVETVLNTSRSSGLPPGSVDLALMVDVYHELSEPQEMLRSLKEALRPNGRLVLIEFRAEDPDVPIRPEHKMSVADARKELEAEGYVFEKVISNLPWQHILIFRRAS